jgi:hypothetical protein
VLLPSSFQEVSQSVFTIVGADFWQKPETASERAHSNKLRLFTNLCLLFLVQSPKQLQSEATVVSQSTEGAILRISGDPTRTLRLAANGRPHSLEYPSEVITQGEAPRMVKHTFTIARFALFGSIWFPSAITESFSSNPIEIEFYDIRVNEGVAEDNFRRPGSIPGAD